VAAAQQRSNREPAPRQCPAGVWTASPPRLVATSVVGSGVPRSGAPSDWCICHHEPSLLRGSHRGAGLVSAWAGGGTSNATRSPNARLSVQRSGAGHARAPPPVPPARTARHAATAAPATSRRAAGARWQLSPPWRGGVVRQPPTAARHGRCPCNGRPAGAVGRSPRRRGFALWRGQLSCPRAVAVGVLTRGVTPLGACPGKTGRWRPHRDRHQVTLRGRAAVWGVACQQPRGGREVGRVD